MSRLRHGEIVPELEVVAAREAAARGVSGLSMAFVAAPAPELQRFDFLFPDLQYHPDHLLPVAPATREALIELGRAMLDPRGDQPEGDADIPAAITYLGQFIDHDITLDQVSATLPELLDAGLEPLSLQEVRQRLRNARVATLDLDSVYDGPVPRDGDELLVGEVTPLGGTEPPTLRPPGKDDHNDLPRQEVSEDPNEDRAALTGDPRNDENLIISQLHVAFLRAHNALVRSGKSFDEARTLLRQHYQHLVLREFLPQVCDPLIIRRIIEEGPRFYDGLREPFFLPLEFSVAAYRFGHTMVRSTYDFNLNFNTSGDQGTFPATLELLFTFTALSGNLGGGATPGAGPATLPDNWIIEWERFVDVGVPFNKARALDTRLVEPLFALPDTLGIPELGDGARLAVRNLLRGYLLRMPTGQAIAQAIGAEPLTPAQLRQAVGDDQFAILDRSGMVDRTPLWYYVLAEAAANQGGHLGAVGSTIVGEVLFGLALRSDDSILRQPDWKPTLPSKSPGTFLLADLLKLAGVLEEPIRMGDAFNADGGCQLRFIRGLVAPLVIGVFGGAARGVTEDTKIGDGGLRILPIAMRSEFFNRVRDAVDAEGCRLRDRIGFSACKTVGEVIDFVWDQVRFQS